MIWKVKPRCPPPVAKIAQEDHGGERGDDLHHEHHRVLDHQARVELDERLPDRRQKDRGVQHRGLGLAHLVANFHGLAACVKEGARVHREVFDDGAE